jgi:two-component system cell cycle sensor histidine kinase/response regulator CckA
MGYDGADLTGGDDGAAPFSSDVRAERDLTAHLLQLISAATDLHELARDVTGLMIAWSECDAVGIRLREGDDYPYFETRGFPSRFVRAENSLCGFDERGEVIRESSGRPVLECMCGNVILGRVDRSLPFFTDFGSFWTNSTSHLLATTTEAGRQSRTRNRCNSEGFESVALVPLRYGQENLGLLQFNDRRVGRFTRESIALLEKMAMWLAFGLVKRREAAEVKAGQADLRALLDAVDESMFMMDGDGVVLAANSVAAVRLGLTPEQLIGRNIFNLLPPAIAQTRRLHVEIARAAGKPVGFTDQRDGIWFEHSIFPVLDSQGEVTRLAVYGRDVSARVKADQDLRNAEARYHTIIDTSPLSILLVRDGHYIYSNAAGAERLGYTPAEVVGLPVETTIDPRDLELIQQRLRDFVAGRPNPAVEVTMINRDGSRIVNEATSVPIDLPDGPAFLVMSQDITVRKQAQEAVRLQAMVLDQIQDLVSVTDLEGRITYVNDAECRVLKRSRSELIGASIEMYGEDLTRGATQREIIERTLADGSWRGDVVNYAADGQDATLDCRTHVVRDQAGEAVAMCGIATDVSEIRQKERELRESEQRFRLLYEQLPVGYQSLDEQGRILDVNQAWLEALGYEHGEVSGRSFVEFLAPDQVVAFEQGFPLFKTQGCTQVEFDLLRKDGSRVTMLFVGRVGRDASGRFVQAHYICTDMTERHDLEHQCRQAQKMEAVGRLAAGVAHDFNNQLTVILGYGDLLLAGSQPGDQSWRRLSEIMMAGGRARETISHLLSFSRKQILDPQFTNLNELLGGFVGPVGTMIGEDIKLVIAAAPDIQPVLVDRSAMHQAVMNLVVNARDAMPRGGELVLRVANLGLTAEDLAEYPELEPGPHVVLEVQDSGVGMDQYTRERLFEPFFTTKPTGMGTGLGLPMVQGFVRQSHGAIVVHSEPGRGTTVRILLPAVLVVPEPVVVDTAVERAAAPRGTETILVVEDDAAVRGMVVSCLAMAGYKVLEAAGPREAVTVVDAHRGPLDLLVTDVVMPEMNGVELAAVIKTTHESAKVLFMSGYLDEETHQKVQDILLKPFSPVELALRVRRALDEVREPSRSATA